ncbi:CARDB domain-containing protein [Chloroflexota bacterium]
MKKQLVAILLVVILALSTAVAIPMHQAEAVANNPDINVEKSTSDTGYYNGTVVTYTYVVTNTGDCSLDVTLMDNIIGNPSPISGDTNSNGLLDVTEVWTYEAQCTLECQPEEQHWTFLRNAATALGNDDTGVSVVDDAFWSLMIFKWLPRTIGYWGNWDNQMDQNNMSSLVRYVNLQSDYFGYPGDGDCKPLVAGDVHDLLLGKSLKGKMTYKKALSLLEKQLLATWLNVKSYEAYIAGYDWGSLDRAIDPDAMVYFDGGSMTVRALLDRIEDAIICPPIVEATAGQTEFLLEAAGILDMINNAEHNGYYMFIDPTFDPTACPVPRAHATEIMIEQVVQPFWEQADQNKGLRTSQYIELLPKGTHVQPAFTPEGAGLPELYCENDSWLFMIDELPGAHFAHPVQIVLVDADTGVSQGIQAEWWPEVDGKPVFDMVEKREDPGRIVFYEPPLYAVEPIGEFKWPGLIVSGLGCEAWAVIICGYNDLPDTFDDDTNGIYNVMRNLDVPDDHIYYVSPHTTHSGVDRATSNANVQWAISEVASQSDASDRVLFFYSSHGNIDVLSCTGGGGNISAANLDNWLDAITCQQMTIVIEACHSGSFIGKYADGTYTHAENDLTGDGETNRAIFTSASTDTSSWPDKDGTDDPNNADVGSETIWGFVEAFSTPSADTNGNGEISFGEAFQYAYNNDVTRIRGWNEPQEEHNGLNIANVYNYCPQPDLVVQSITHSPLSPTTLDEITFTAIVKNQGVGASGPCKLSFKVGGETIPPIYDIPYLAPGATFSIQETRVLGVAQGYLVTVKVDIDNDISESSETNNQRTHSLTVYGAIMPGLN